MPEPDLKVIAFNCSLKSAADAEASSTDVLLAQFLDALKKHGASGQVIRAVDHNIKPGVTSDQGAGDAWPALRKLVVDADILVMATPIWLGQPSSVAKRVMERLDAFLDEKDERGRMPSYGKVAVVVVVGNEDGAHHTAAEIQAGLIEVGFTFRRAARPTGSARRWARRSTRTCRNRRRRWRSGPRCWRPTSRTSPACSSERTIPASRAAGSGAALPRTVIAGQRTRYFLRR